MQKYSIFNLVKNAFSNHENWDLAWKDPTPKEEYDVVIIGGVAMGLLLPIISQKNTILQRWQL